MVSQYFKESQVNKSSNNEFQENVNSTEAKSTRRKKNVDKDNQALKESFDAFIDEIKYASNKSQEALFDDIIKSLSFKIQGILDISQLARIFDGLSRKVSSKPRYGKVNWTEEETNFLVSIVAYHCSIFEADYHSISDKEWEDLSKIFPTKQATQLNKRWNSILKVNLVQKPWTTAEDKLLGKLVAEHGSERQWKTIADQINAQFLSGTFRHSRQCRERWNNYVDPRINRGGWSQDDDTKLMKAFLQVGKKWSAIAKLLGNRTENAVRNRYNSLIKKQNSNGLEKNLSETEQGSEMIATNYVAKAGTQQTFEYSEGESQYTEELQDCSYEQDFQAQETNYGYQVAETGAPMYQTEVYNEVNSNMVYLKPVWNQSTPSYTSSKWETNEEVNYSYQSFVFSSGYETEQKFSQEVTKGDSMVFYAMINAATNEMKIMDKVSESNWPRFMCY